MGPYFVYKDRVNSGTMSFFPEQDKVLGDLQSLFLEVMRPSSLWNIFFKKKKQVRSVYLFGGVGQGKTTLSDLLCSCLPQDSVLRLHFYEFMSLFHRLRMGTKESFERTVDRLIGKQKLILFDEFYVTNIADAMILKNIFLYLIKKKGLLCVFTSNFAPEELYKNGLRRENFLPFIEFVKQEFNIHCINIGHDLRGAESDDSLASNEVNWFMQRFYGSYSQGENCCLQLKHATVIGQCAGKNFLSTYHVLCEENFSYEDYFSLIQSIDKLFLDCKGVNFQGQEAAILRFITLVDIFYNAGKPILILADQEKMQGDDLFLSRTFSRLREMMTREKSLIDQ